MGGATFLTRLGAEGSLRTMRRARGFMAWGVAPVFAGIVFWLCGDVVTAAPLAERAAKSAPARPVRRDEVLAGFDPRVRELVDGRLTSRLSRGQRAVLSLDPALDTFVTKLLKKNEVPFAGVAAIEPSTGRVLAYVSHSSAEPRGPDRVLEAAAPAASVFKLITASALLNEGLSPARTTCYHGGSHMLTSRELVDNPRLDTACASLTGALGFSINAVFGKLALRHLDPKKLARQASAYGFGENLPFDVPAARSPIDVPADKLEFARTAAGFWHSRLSPLHGAMIAASIANGGRMMRPQIVERVLDTSKQVVLRSEPVVYRKVVEPHTADQLATMMRATVQQGTSRRTFHDARGRPLLPGIDVAGKTGTLSQEKPYRGYTWWVGFAPVKAPKIALAVLIVNSPNWRIKASQVAAETLRHYLVEQPRRGGDRSLAQSR